MGYWAQNPVPPAPNTAPGAVPYPGEMSGSSLPALWAGNTRLFSGRDQIPESVGWCRACGQLCRLVLPGGAPQTPGSAFDGVITAGV